MALKYLASATVYFNDSNTEKTFPSVSEARRAAERYVGNTASAKPFPDEETYLYGPGNGDCTVTVRQDLDMVAFMGRCADRVDPTLNTSADTAESLEAQNATTAEGG